MHLQQTKRGSRETGGPQYYFHNLTKVIKGYLRKEGAVPVALVTPYGATRSDFVAVGAKHKLDPDLRPGSVGHDRIQHGIGEAIRKWYQLPQGDFERIDVEVEVQDDALYLTPLSCVYTDKRVRRFKRVDRPLTFTHEYASPFWKEQIGDLQSRNADLLSWVIREICRVVKDHRPESKLPHIQEQGLLRASGPLRHLGLALGGYVGKGYDCISQFSFLKLPTYEVPVELKRNSQGFRYQERKYGKNALSRAVVLCAIHDHDAIPKNIDVIELQGLCTEGLRLWGKT